MAYSSVSDFRQFLKQPFTLPVLPQTVLILSARISERKRGREVTYLDAAAYDPVMVAALLKNFCLPGSSHTDPWKSIQQAIDLFDRSPFSNAFHNLKIQSGPSRLLLNLQTLQRHALGCAVISELLAARMGYSAPQEAFLAGLLHDLGKIILFSWDPPSFDRVLEQTEDQRLPALPIEETVFGIGHTLAGKIAMELWNFPEFLAIACARHHQSFAELATKDQATTLTLIVQQSNRLCHLWRYGGPSCLSTSERHELCSITGLSNEDFCSLFAEASSRIRTLESSLQLTDKAEEAVLAALQGRLPETNLSRTAESDPGAHSLEPRPEDNVIQTRHAILVIEDDEGLRRLLLEVLKRAGYEAEGAEDGLAAIKKLIASRYLAAILDLQMPQIDGMEVLVTSQRVDPDMPIIVLTGVVGAGDAAREAGAFRCLQKPASNDEILRALTEALASRKESSRHDAKPGPEQARLTDILRKATNG
ncbi:MAG TPA: HDOD domain-containing protein [Acidobacteriota bacterium]|nr:HDOD domain-containing protein [Acidobacteriota bacterium]